MEVYSQRQHADLLALLQNNMVPVVEENRLKDCYLHIKPLGASMLVWDRYAHYNLTAEPAPPGARRGVDLAKHRRLLSAIRARRRASSCPKRLDGLHVVLRCVYALALNGYLSHHVGIYASLTLKLHGASRCGPNPVSGVVQISAARLTSPNCQHFYCR